MDLAYYRKFIKSSESTSNIEVSQLSEDYSNQYNHAISPFDIIINSDRADTIYKNNISYKCVVDYNKIYGKGDFSSSNNPFKEIWCNYSDNFKVGDLIQFENRISKTKVDAIFMRLKETREGYMTGFIQECNFDLKWTDKITGAKLSQCVILESKNPYSPGIDEAPKMVIGDNQRAITMSDNEKSRRFNRSDEFLIGDIIYRVSSIDRETNLGLCIMVVTEYQKGQVEDDRPVLQDVYTIDINTDNLSIVTGGSYQLQPIVKKNDMVINSEIIYSTNNSDVATVSESGLIQAVGLGSVNITINLKDNQDISDSVSIEVVSIPVNNIDYRFNTDAKSSISIYDKAIYSFYKYENNIADATVFTFELDYNGNPTNIANLSNVSSNGCTVVANTNQIYGTIYLVVKELGIERGILEIKIKSMWG